jgi:DNA-binding MarR family transcriptional regulator
LTEQLTTISAEQPMIGALMRMPSEAISARIVAGLHEAGFTDIVSAHLNVLRYPGPESRRPSDLAAEAGMTKQAMNYLLGQLQVLGYLTRKDDPNDQRSKRICLTARGVAVRRAIRRTVREIEGELERELGSDHFALVCELLTRLNDTELVRSHFRRQLDQPRPARIAR